MNIAIVSETFPPEINGVAMTFGTIARELARRGNAVRVYRPHRSDLPRVESEPAFSQISLPGMPIPRYPLLRLGLPARARLRHEWTADRPDLVHVVTEGPLGASAVTVARRLDIPVTSSFHTNFHVYTAHYGFGLLGRAALGWLRWVHNRTQRTFAPTQAICQQLSAVGFNHMALLSRGVDSEEFDPRHRVERLRESWGAENGDPVVIHVGRLAPEKNFDLLFRSFAAMHRANPRCRFVVVGDGPLRARLERENPRFIFTGFISRGELAQHYASADIYIHASLTETFGNVLTEAMASGLAVAGFDYAAALQFVRHGESGLTAPCADANALVEAAVLLASNEAVRARVRMGARRSVATQSWETVINRFEGDLMQVAMERDTALKPGVA